MHPAKAIAQNLCLRADSRPVDRIEYLSFDQLNRKTKMNQLQKNASVRPLFMASLLAALLTGCGGGGDGGTVDANASMLAHKPPVASGQAPINLGTAGNFVMLSKAGISTVPSSVVTGDIGVSPIAHTAITGFSETMDLSNKFSTSAQVVGKMYAADYTAPTPTYMTTAVSDMEIAYTDAAGRTLPGFTELGAGEIGGLTLVPGLYKWGTDVSISTDVTLSGGPNDVWIFQIAGNLNEAAGKKVTLIGGALPQNVFWQSAGAVAIGTTAHFEGVVLSKTMIAMKTGASVNGRLLAQTAVTLDQSTVTQPAAGTQGGNNNRK
jgi:Ice-binding-like